MKKVINILLPILLCFTAHSQNISLPDSQTEQKSESIEIYFDSGIDSVDSLYMNNSESVSALYNHIRSFLLDNTQVINRVVIDGYTSPEGDNIANKKLSQNRAKAVRNYIKSIYFIPDSLIVVRGNGVDWSEFREAVVNSQTPHKNEVIDLIDNTPVETWIKEDENDSWKTLNDSLNKRMMDLRAGIPYRYMRANIFPELCRVDVETLYTESEQSAENRQRVVDQDVIERIIAGREPSQSAVAVDKSDAAVESPELKESVELLESQKLQEKVRKPLFAIKTNMLYDLALTPNIELEIPIKDRWSIGAQVLYGWWGGSEKNNNSFAWQLQAADIEGRYWFGDRTDKQPLSGWFAGVFASTGFYDIQFKSDRGTQGEFYVLTGVSGGYSMPLRHNLYLEFAAGVGYIINDYQKYVVADGKYLISDGAKMRFQSIFPAKLEVSLGWLLFNKRGGRK